jgi:dipeptidyl aminopeptidase/acylaminoacyl peptidase
MIPMLFKACFFLACPAAAASSAASDTDFLKFPYVETVSAAKVPAFAWLVRQGSQTSVLFARAPQFGRRSLVARSDEDGQPITDVQIAPDGTRLVYTTGAPKADSTFNPASLVEPPETTLWLMSTTQGSKPVKIGLGLSASFSPDGRLMLFKRAGDLWSIDPTAPTASPKLVAKGGAAWSSFVWTKDRELIFVDHRQGYSFLGRFRLDSPRVEWLITGADRLAMPVLSPGGTEVALLRFPGRKHSTVHDQTEAEPFSIAVHDLASGTTRTVWTTRGPAVTLGMDDPESALRWASNDQLVFYSEDDGWGRLYALALGGGAPRPITPPNCMVAESEDVGDQILVIHNCRDLDARQMSLVAPGTGAERPVASPGLVLAQARAAGGYVALVGADADQAPLLRIVDAKSGQSKLTEGYADYGYRSPLAGPAPRPVRLTAKDGLGFSAQLFLPATPGRHPAIVYVHGGPQRQMFPAFHYSGYYASDYAINRRLAEQGYVVLAVNYRSGTGYGRAFRDAPGRAWRNASEYQDVLAAGRWLAGRAFVDHRRIGIWGGSYGGLLTAQALARDSELFKAGAAVHGVFDWSWPSPIKGHLNPSVFFGVDEKDRPQARAASPLASIDKWRSPVLLFSGDADMNVDVVETVDLSARLNERGGDVRTVLVPGEAHGFVRHSAWELLWRELDSFFAKKLR